MDIIFDIPASFYPNVRFFFYGKILVGDIEGGAKKTLSSKKKTPVFAPPSPCHPRLPPTPPVGNTAPAHSHTHSHTHTHTHTRTHTHIHTLTRTDTHSHTHTYTH